MLAVSHYPYCIGIKPPKPRYRMSALRGPLLLIVGEACNSNVEDLLSQSFLSRSPPLKNARRKGESMTKAQKVQKKGMQSVMMVQAWASKVRAGKGSKGDRLGIVDHSTINYPPFRKNFYIEVCCHLVYALGYQPPAFGTLCALQQRNALRRADAVLLVSHLLCQALGQANVAFCTCASATREAPNDSSFTQHVVAASLVCSTHCLATLLVKVSAC